MHYIIGCGGVGSFLAPALCMLVGKENVTLIDGDTLEAKNLNRQLFTESEIGSNKAEALARKYGCAFVDNWYSESLMPHDDGDWLFGVVDNHTARRAILASVDRFDCQAILAANEVHSSEAYVYYATWRDTRIDPRVMYPEINSDDTNDPRSATIGCTGEAQSANVQLVTANFMAASLAAHLYVIWGMEAGKLEADTLRHLPHKLVQNLTRNETHKVGEI
jgi:hypothetical protein